MTLFANWEFAQNTGTHPEENRDTAHRKTRLQTLATKYRDRSIAPPLALAPEIEIHISAMAGNIGIDSFSFARSVSVVRFYPALRFTPKAIHFSFSEQISIIRAPFCGGDQYVLNVGSLHLHSVSIYSRSI